MNSQLITDNSKLKQIIDSQKNYIKYRAEKDPARGMFTKLYGAEWTEEYIQGFLFDLERKLSFPDRYPTVNSLESWSKECRMQN